MSKQLRVKEIILVPAIISLLVSILRLTGELLGWSETLFSRAAGGGGSLIGISWLVVVFGVYFAWKLTKMGFPVQSAGRLLGLSFLAIVIVVGAALLAQAALGLTSSIELVAFAVLSVAVIFLVRSSWPELFRTLVAYGFAARIPVIIIMYFAIMGDWGTHYDSPPPEMEGMGWFTEWVITGVIPQATIWIAFTVIIGSLFAALTAIFVKAPESE
jgi:hypothetical protein